jgi:methyl-accepting chemotaxis protein
MTIKQYARRGTGALIALVVLGIVIAGIAIREIGFGGPIFRANQLHSDLVADILPPPQYAIEPFLETTIIIEDRTLDGHTDALANLRNSYEERKAYWRNADISDELKAQMAVTNKSADAFWTDADALVAAAQAGDWVGAKLIHDTRITPEFITHRAEINKLVEMAAQEKTKLDERSVLLLYISLWGASDFGQHHRRRAVVRHAPDQQPRRRTRQRNGIGNARHGEWELRHRHIRAGS